MQIQRSLVRHLRGVFRRLVKKPCGDKPIVCFRGDRDGLRVRLHTTDVLAEFQHAGSFAPETVAVPFEALADFEGTGDAMVALEAAGPDKVQARWDDAGVPQVRDHALPDPERMSKFPDTSPKLAQVGPDFWKALADASVCTAKEGVRFALQKIQLRGRSGTVVGTDGRQMLMQTGFRFPFTEDVLIPASTVFGCKELVGTTEASLGVVKQFVVVQTGAWSFYFPIDKEGRYPKVEQSIPSLTGTVTRCRISPDDARFLAKTLSRLPGGEDEHAPVTVDLNSHMAVRARDAEQGRVTEALLTQSNVMGSPVRFNANRDLLARALALGFRDFAVVKADVPIVCEATRRKFVFMPLGKEGALGPSEDAVRITSADMVAPAKEGTPDRKQMPPPDRGVTNGATKEERHPATMTPPLRIAPQSLSRSTPVHDLLTEAAALKDVLRDGFARVTRLIAGLQQHRKQSRVVQSTLASLRQLQRLGED